jgi:hypothetical protein
MLKPCGLAAYQSFNDRRNYEWKFSLAIWTALAVMIAGLTQLVQTGETFVLHGRYHEIGSIVFGALLLLLHIYFNNCLARANAIDRKKMQNYANHIESVLKLNMETDLAKEIASRISHYQNSLNTVGSNGGIGDISFKSQ